MFYQICHHCICIESKYVLGRGRRPGTGRGRRNLSTMLGASPPGGQPQSETAQIMLSLSGTSNGQILQTTSRNIRISPNTRMERPIQPATSSMPISNGVLTTTDLKTLREQLNLEPRRRGRRRQNYGFGRGKIKDFIEAKLGPQTIKNDPEELHQKGSIHFMPASSKVSVNTSNGNNDPKSPLLATLLSKAESLAKEKIKTENEASIQSEEQETVVYQFDGESSGASKYLDALKEAGLPTDVPVLIDNGDGNYVTLTEDVLMNVLGNNEDIQFHLTEATLQQGDVNEGVVLPDGTIMMTGKNIKPDGSGPLFTVGKKSVSVRGVRDAKIKRQPRQRQSTAVTKLGEKTASPRKTLKKESTPIKSEIISNEVLESLKNGAATEAEADPDAVVLFEVTDNQKVCKYVVSSKEISALKALNEQIEKQKKQNSPTGKKDPVPTVVDGNTNIAEITLNFLKNSRKSIVSEVLARAHSLETQALKTGETSNVSDDNSVKNEAKSPDMLHMNMETDLLNETSDMSGIDQSSGSSENTNSINLSGEPKLLNNRMVVLHTGDQFMHISDGQHEGLALSCNENLIVVNNNEQLHQPKDDNCEDSEMMQMNGSQDGGDRDTETTQEAIEDITDDDLNASIDESGKDMPMLENESHLVELQFIDGNGEKIERYRLEGTVLSEKDLSELTNMNNHNKNTDVMGLLDMVCEEATSAVHAEGRNNELTNISIPCTTAVTISVTSGVTSIQPFYSAPMTSSSGNLELVEALKREETRHFETGGLPLDEDDCNELSAEQATNSDPLALDEAFKTIDACELDSDLITFNKRGHQNISIKEEQLRLEDTVKINTRSLESGGMSLDEAECRVSNTVTRHLLNDNDIILEDSDGQESSTGQCKTDYIRLENVDSKSHKSDLESDIMRSLDEGDCDVLSVATSRPEHFVLEDAVANTGIKHLEHDEMTLGEGCEDISVEQALQAMMGDDGNTSEQNQQFSEKSLDMDGSQIEDNLHQQTLIADEVSNSDTIQYLFVPENTLSVSNQKFIPSDCESQILFKEGVKTDESEAAVISPTKDVPFAVGLLPLKEALKQIQSVPDFQPRKTRASSASKPDFGVKRHISTDNSACEIPVKRRKSAGEENSSVHLSVHGSSVIDT